MPTYCYINDDTEETIEVVQRMNEPHEYFDKNGKKWRRVFSIPHATIDGSIDPFDEKSFIAKTGAKKGTMGDLLDASKEASEKRAARTGGVDPVKQQFFDRYKKERGGKRHPQDKPSIIENKNWQIEL